MAKMFSPLKAIDNVVLEQVEVFKDSQAAQKLMEKYNILEDHQQKYVNFGLMIATIGIPLILCFVFFLISLSAQSELDKKEEIIESASRIIAKKNQMNSYTNKVFGFDLSSNSAFKSKINTLLNAAQIDTSKIQITDFDSFETSGINNASATLKFTGLSDKNFFAAIRKMFIQEKFKVTELVINKNKSSNLLDGSFSVIYYSKVSGKSE